LDQIAGIPKTVDFTERFPLTKFMSTTFHKKIPEATLHNGVEISVEVVEALEIKGLP